MKSINFKSIVIVASLFLSGTTISLAQCGGHSSHSQSAESVNPPHGGMIKSSGKYHIEMVVNLLQKDDKVSVYLLDKKGKILPNKDVTGTIMFMSKDNAEVEVQLVAKGDDHFVTQLKDTKPFTAMVSLKVKGKTVNASFEHGGLNALAKTATYICPMKCEGEKTYDEHGSCPKCGMNLVKKK